MAWGLGSGVHFNIGYSKKVESINYCRKNSTTKTSQYDCLPCALLEPALAATSARTSDVYISRRAEQLLKEVLLPRGRPEVVLVREEPNL